MTAASRAAEEDGVFDVRPPKKDISLFFSFSFFRLLFSFVGRSIYPLDSLCTAKWIGEKSLWVMCWGDVLRCGMEDEGKVNEEQAAVGWWEVEWVQTSVPWSIEAWAGLDLILWDVAWVSHTLCTLQYQYTRWCQFSTRHMSPTHELINFKLTIWPRGLIESKASVIETKRNV